MRNPIQDSSEESRAIVRRIRARAESARAHRRAVAERGIVVSEDEPTLVIQLSEVR